MKSLWMRMGISIPCSEEEMQTIREGGAEGKNIIRKKFMSGKCSIDGETYIPARETGSENEWPVDEDIEFLF